MASSEKLYVNRIISRHKSQTREKKAKHDNLKSNFRKINSNVARSHSKSPIISSFESFNKQFIFYERERKKIKTRVSKFQYKSEIDLKDRIKEQGERLTFLEKENPKLGSLANSSLTPIKLLNSEEEMILEAKVLKKSISNIEKNLSNISKKLKASTEKEQVLKETLEKLKKQSGYSENNKKLKKSKTDVRVKRKMKVKDKETLNFEELENKLKTVTRLWEKNMDKYENCIKEKETELKSLRYEDIQVRSKFLKQMQKKRLLDMSFDFYSKMKDNKSYTYLMSDICYLDVRFLYKPSIKDLYSS